MPARGSQEEGDKQDSVATLLHFPAPQDTGLLAWRMAAAGTGPSEGSPGLCRGSPQGLQCGLSCNGRGVVPQKPPLQRGGGDGTSPPQQPCSQGVTAGTALPRALGLCKCQWFAHRWGRGCSLS